MTTREAARGDDAFRRPHVLIVSDDTGLSGFLSEGLVIAGFWTSTVASALQCLEVFRIRTFDLMLLDALLPGLGAAELITRLRAPEEATGRPRTDIPILLIAERQAEIDALGSPAEAVDGVVLAPIEIEELALALFEIVKRWRAAHPDRPWADDLAQGVAPQ
jgi:DNA-binding response OmpR family regulator